MTTPAPLVSPRSLLAAAVAKALGPVVTLRHRRYAVRVVGGEVRFSHDKYLVEFEVRVTDAGGVFLSTGPGTGPMEWDAGKALVANVLAALA